MQNVEHWGQVAQLRGHSLDVVDLAWAENDAFLASCGCVGLLEWMGRCITHTHTHTFITGWTRW